MTRSYNVSNFGAKICNNSSEFENNSTEKNNETEKRTKLSLKTKLFFSVGHIYNDLCASIWFSYTLLFFKLHLECNYAGALLLLGQVADALATPFIGFESDRNDTSHWMCRYGKRKTWHLVGTLLVTISFPFIFNVCINCENASSIPKFVYYGAFIIFFQFGWAAVQVGHVSLITDLTKNSSERIELNAYRQACTVASSVLVYTIMLLVVGFKNNDAIKKEDSGIFTKVVYIVCAIGIVFSFLFHIFVKEPDSNNQNNNNTNNCKNKSDDIWKASVYRMRSHSGDRSNLPSFCAMKRNRPLEDGLNNNNPNEQNKNDNKKWSDWLKTSIFYKVGFIYMMSRLFVNLTQVYTPLYLQDTLNLPKQSIAIIPFVTYVSGFFFSILIKLFSKRIGSKILLIIGCVFGGASCIWIYFGNCENEAYKHWQVYGVAFLFGVGGTTMLIASLAIAADLIGNNDKSSAFVFGAMSFLDKLMNGSVVALLEQFYPKQTAESETFISIKYYQHILVYISGAAVVLTLIGLLIIINKKFIQSNTSSTQQDQSQVIN